MNDNEHIDIMTDEWLDEFVADAVKFLSREPFRIPSFFFCPESCPNYNNNGPSSPCMTCNRHKEQDDD